MSATEGFSTTAEMSATTGFYTTTEKTVEALPQQDFACFSATAGWSAHGDHHNISDFFNNEGYTISHKF